MESKTVPPRRARLSAEARRRQIIDEATRIIGLRGYFGFSLQEVADACGMTQAGILHHVGSKDELLQMVLEFRDEADLASLAESSPVAGRLLSEPTITTVENALHALHMLTMRNASQPEIVRLYSVLRNESLYDAHPSHDYFCERDRLALTAFVQWFTGHVPDPDAFARQVLALMGGLEEQWLRTPEMDLVGEWDKAIACLLRGAQT